MHHGKEEHRNSFSRFIRSYFISKEQQVHQIGTSVSFKGAVILLSCSNCLGCFSINFSNICFAKVGFLYGYCWAARKWWLGGSMCSLLPTMALVFAMFGFCLFCFDSFL